jgi:hypothetical protein
MLPVLVASLAPITRSLWICTLATARRASRSWRGALPYYCWWHLPTVFATICRANLVEIIYLCRVAYERSLNCLLFFHAAYRPCNQFGRQESGSPAEIASFVKARGVAFDMMVRNVLFMQSRFLMPQQLFRP